ncbi:TetR/AcrR family transcriptional regulator, partial [Vitreimonas sp.]|uniref:TetR/AcrR family transcriptional regulator n=1 Tax=Vitreimonas sp. TaxID=3069702 RepID=UPI002ED9A5D4
MTQRPTQDATSLERRTSPTQKRARERIQRILEATAHLLANTPLESITTSTIAAEAGVPVSSIYRYFPNVQAIYKEMFEGLVSQLHLKVAAISDDTKRWPSWRARHREVMRAMRAVMGENPAYPPLFYLMASTRELRALKDNANAQIAAHLAARWARGEDGFHGGDPLIVARMATEIFTAFEVLASGGDADLAEKLFAETSLALESYLSLY